MEVCKKCGLKPGSIDRFHGLLETNVTLSCVYIYISLDCVVSNTMNICLFVVRQMSFTIVKKDQLVNVYLDCVVSNAMNFCLFVV